MPDYQSAYHMNNSYESAVMKTVDDVLWVLEFQEVSNLCLPDLSIAFGIIDNDILFFTLNIKFGVQHTSIQCFDSYLHPRHCMVKVGESYSLPKSLMFLVPQGSVAGPNL